MLGNLLKESGQTERIAKAAQNELMNIITIFLGISVGATTSAQSFLNLNSIKRTVVFPEPAPAKIKAGPRLCQQQAAAFRLTP